MDSDDFRRRITQGLRYRMETIVAARQKVRRTQVFPMSPGPQMLLPYDSHLRISDSART
jgi:hypothetical protein